MLVTDDYKLIKIEEYRKELKKLYGRAGMDARVKQVSEMSISDLLDSMLQDAVLLIKRRNFVEEYKKEV